jgi:hypothetical protein
MGGAPKDAISCSQLQSGQRKRETGYAVTIWSDILLCSKSRRPPNVSLIQFAYRSPISSRPSCPSWMKKNRRDAGALGGSDSIASTGAYSVGRLGDGRSREEGHWGCPAARGLQQGLKQPRADGMLAIGGVARIHSRSGVRGVGLLLGRTPRILSTASRPRPWPAVVPHLSTAPRELLSRLTSFSPPDSAKSEG